MRKVLKNKFIKLSLIFMVLLSSFFIANPIINANDEAPKQIRVTEGKALPRYDASMGAIMFRLDNGSYAYCLDAGKGSPINSTLYLDKELDAGFAYLLENGYPNNSITGNRDKDYYITQAAIWMYADKTMGQNRVPRDFKNLTSEVAKIANILSTKAITARNRGYLDPKMQVKSTYDIAGKIEGEYYVSSPVNISGDFKQYNVELVNGPRSARIVDAYGNMRNNFKVNEPYFVKVLISDMTKGAKINTKVNAVSRVTKAYKYRPADNLVQSVMPIISTSSAVKIWTEVNFELALGSASILKVDDETRKPISGAHLELVDAKGRTLKSWVSTKSPELIMHLKPGVYEIRETKAPQGYQKTLKTVTFNVAAYQNTKVVVTNYRYQKGTLLVVKRDEKGNPLTGAKLRLLNGRGEEVYRWESNDKAKRFSNLPYGTYTVEELEAPQGYKKTDKKYTVVLNGNDAVVINVVNGLAGEEVAKGTVRIGKYDASTGNYLAGAHIQVKNEKGEVVADYISEQKAKVIEGLKDGFYYVVELAAPNGFKRYTDRLDFAINNGKSDKEIKLYNTREISVPITDTNMNLIPIILGSFMVLFGLIGIYQESSYERK